MAQYLFLNLTVDLSSNIQDIRYLSIRLVHGHAQIFIFIFISYLHVYFIIALFYLCTGYQISYCG